MTVSKTFDATTSEISYTLKGLKDNDSYIVALIPYKKVDGKEVTGLVSARYAQFDEVVLDDVCVEKVSSREWICLHIGNIESEGSKIYRAEAGGEFKCIATTDDPYWYYDETAVPGKTYQYKVSSKVRIVKYSYQESSTFYRYTVPSNTVTITYGSKLATPTPTVKNYVDGVMVNWDGIGGADSYIVYRKEAGKSYASIGTTKGMTSTSYLDHTAESGKTYYYTVKAANSSTRSSYKSSKAITYIADPKVSVENTSQGVKISWTKSAGATGYYVYCKVVGGSYVKIKTITNGSTLSYTDPGTRLVSGMTFYYTVKAYNSNTSSSYSSAGIMYLSSVKPTVSATSGKVTLNWSKINYVDGYYVYRKTEGGSWSRIAKLEDLYNCTYTDTSAKKGTKYYYCVKGYDGKYTSSYITSDAVIAK